MPSFEGKQTVSSIVAVLKFNFVEMLRDGPDSENVFSIVALDGTKEPSDTDPRRKSVVDLMVSKVLPKMFPNSIPFSTIHGFDYLVLNAYVDGHEMAMFPGTLLYVRADGSYGVIISSTGVPEVSLLQGVLAFG